VKKHPIFGCIDTFGLRYLRKRLPTCRRRRQRQALPLEVLEHRCLLSGVGMNTDAGTLSGQKWHDLNADGVKDLNEPGLDGWRIQLLDNTGAVVKEVVTESIDANNDGHIDPFTESGRYSILAGSGTWSVSEVPQRGWQQTTAPSDSQSALLYSLDQQLHLKFTGKYFENWGGDGEKWMLSPGGWHYVTPDGALFRWDGESRAPLLGQFVARTSPLVHEVPGLLHDATEPELMTMTLDDEEAVHGLDFGNVPTGSIEGRSWNDINADRLGTPNEPGMNGWTVQLEDKTGNIVATTVTSDTDRNADGQIDPLTETGWYSFERLVPGDYRVRQISKPHWTLLESTGPFAQQAFELDQELDFRSSVSSFFNWGGLQEKWFWSRRQSWHYITPDGGLYRWDRDLTRSLSGTLIAQLEPGYWLRPALIYNARNPDPFGFSIAGQKQKGVDFGNVLGRDGTGIGNLNLTIRDTTILVSGNEQANSLVVYADAQQHVIIQGSGSTTINGSAVPIYLFPHTAGFPVNLSISLRGGLDQVTVFDASLNASLHLELGTGDDVLLMSDSKVAGDLSITSPRGDIQLRLHDSMITGNVAVFTSGDSVNLTSLQNVSVGRDLSVAHSGGADTVFLQEVTVGNATYVDTGRGGDSIVVHRSLFSGDVAILTRNGHDLIALLNTDFRNSVHVYAGNNDDVVGNTWGNEFAFDTGFHAGPGDDTYADDGTATHGRIGAINSFEMEDDSTLAGLIDIALSEFDNLLLN